MYEAVRKHRRSGLCFHYNIPAHKINIKLLGGNPIMNMKLQNDFKFTHHEDSTIEWVGDRYNNNFQGEAEEGVRENLLSRFNRLTNDQLICLLLGSPMEDVIEGSKMDAVATTCIPFGNPIMNSIAIVKTKDKNYVNSSFTSCTDRLTRAPLQRKTIMIDDTGLTDDEYSKAIATAASLQFLNDSDAATGLHCEKGDNAKSSQLGHEAETAIHEYVMEKFAFLDTMPVFPCVRVNQDGEGSRHEQCA
jgi:hypothetical protein